jgi:hypothetical protein
MILFDDTIFKLTFKYQLSYLLVPLSVILYIYIESFRTYLFYHMICCGLIGAIDTINYYRLGNTGIVFTITSIICHLCLLFILYNFKKYGKINVVSLLLLFIANLIIIYLPFWPYSLDRKTILLLYNLIYFVLYILSVAK